MTKAHKYLIFIILVTITLIFYIYKIEINDLACQNLVTFFSVAFGFYMTSLAIIYNSNYTKKLYQEIDPNYSGRRKIHTLKNYFLFSCYWSILTIVLLVTKSLRIKPSINNITLNFQSFNFDLDFSQLFDGVIAGVTCVNIVFIIILLKHTMNNLIEESRQPIK